jgi:hypothetical protein
MSISDILDRQLVVIVFEPEHAGLLGFLPSWLDPDDPAKAAEQLGKNYQHGGGWRPFHGFKMDPDNGTLIYPQDPPLEPIAIMILREERIAVYLHGWVAVIQPDLSFEVCRMD